MDGEWDLNAVVRSCATTTPAASAAGKPTTVEDYDDGSYNLESLASGNERNAFVYPSFGVNPSNVSGGLEDVYKVGHGVPAAAAATSAAIDLAGEGFVRDQLPMLTDSHSFSMHTMSSQSTRTRKRKNQDKRVFQLAQEELSNDVWAWRKYGQKPIKGSPFPRNYYRCSTTKACGAKKQVERSPTDATVFIVSYSGEHIHPRPTHRSSLAGSTRSNKFNTDSSSSKPPVSANTTSTIVEHAPCSSSSPANASSISPTTSSKEDDCEMNEDIDEYDDQDILIPNTVTSDDILKRFRDLSRRGGGSGSGSGGSGSGGGGSF